ncbi:hypothetical protein RF11_06645 [Thelohanellus kitauei]|uniref:Uncharacterized protein n=1 Tax=Thelohanellus kitauei TaxID=669202 RepID=A0A0C2J6H6_THEKT|nr:hypothetical protein RF11_06645 [Thelohanellus kitauei]
MSPNIIQIRHIEGLSKSFLHELFNGIGFHKISPPLTPNGVWRLFVANRDDYFLLLSRPPYYESSLRLPLYFINFKSEQTISPSQIYIYSRSNKLQTTEQISVAIPELSDVYIAKCVYEGGNLFIFHIYDRSKFLKILHLNGSSLSKNLNLFKMEPLTIINNISSNILINVNSPHPIDPPKENTAESNINASTRNKLILPKNLKEFKMMMEDIIFTHSSFSKCLIQLVLLHMSLSPTKVSKEDIYRIFDGIPIDSILEIHDQMYRINFTSENFEAARFRIIPGQIYMFKKTSPQQFRILRKKLLYCEQKFRYYFINHFCYESKNVVELPFEHRVLSRSNEVVYCLTSLENYFKYCHKSVQTIFDDEALRLITEQCSLLNIPLEFDRSTRLIKPIFSSFNDLDKFTHFLFSENDIYPEKARFYPGQDLLRL